MGAYPCTECGICCRNVGTVLRNQALEFDPIVRAAIKEFPYGTDENGACEKLVDGKCSVYEERPAICNVDTMADRKGVEREAYYKLSAKACNFMIIEAGLPESFLIKDYDS